MYILNMYWKELTAIAIASTIVWYVQSLRMEVIALSGKNDRLKAYIELQNVMIEADKAEYEAGMKQYEKTTVINHTVYKDKIKLIYQWEDKNATCNDVINEFDSYQY